MKTKRGDKMVNNLARYRKFMEMSQKEMATVANMCLTSYYMKEKGAREFTQAEMFNIYNCIKKRVPEITIEEIFYREC